MILVCNTKQSLCKTKQILRNCFVLRKLKILRCTKHFRFTDLTVERIDQLSCNPPESFYAKRTVSACLCNSNTRISNTNMWFILCLRLCVLFREILFILMLLLLPNSRQLEPEEGGSVRVSRTNIYTKFPTFE